MNSPPGSALITPSARPAGPPPTWAQYLDAVESGALAARRAVLDGEIPVVTEPHRPTGQPGPELDARRAAVVELVEEVTAMVTLHQAAVRERLDALRHPGPRPAGSLAQSLGEHLDIIG